MKHLQFFILLVIGIFLLNPVVSAARDSPLIIDYDDVLEFRNGNIPEEWIQKAKDEFHVAFGHTSHGAQIEEGMRDLNDFMNGGGLGNTYSQDLFTYNRGGTGGALDFWDLLGEWRDHAGRYPGYYDKTRAILDNPDNSHINVFIWTFDHELEWVGPNLQSRYFTPMQQLEDDYPGVTFIYATTRAPAPDQVGNEYSSTGEEWHTRLGRFSGVIRDYTITNNKVLFDNWDLEHHDPDREYAITSDYCDYYDSSYNRLGNWCSEYQNSHTEGVDWYTCASGHSLPLNANQKAYAFWTLLAKLASEIEETCTGNPDCNDGNYCNGAETCVDGSCVAGTDPCPEDDYSCTDITCNEAEDSCKTEYQYTSCDDENSCTTDQCVGASGDSQGCAYTPVPEGGSCADEGNTCTDDICSGGACIHPNKPAGETCNDAVDCTENDQCDGSGSCSGTPNEAICLVDYPDCTSATCNPSTGCGNYLPAGCDAEAGLQLWLKLDDSIGDSDPAEDSSGNGNNGACSVVNCPTLGTIDGRQAYQFDGADDRLNVGSDATIDDLDLQETEGMTVAAWIYPTWEGNNLKMIAAKSMRFGYGSWNFQVYYNSFRFIKDYSTSEFSDDLYRQTRVGPSKNEWQHVAATWSGGSEEAGIRIFMNGEEMEYYEGQNGVELKNSDADNDLFIGQTSNNLYPFEGYIDDVRIYNRVLSPEEIKALYSGAPTPECGNGECESGETCEADSCCDGQSYNPATQNCCDGTVVTGCCDDTDCTGGQICCSNSCQTPLCTDATDCDDGVICSRDICLNPGACTAACQYESILDCCGNTICDMGEECPEDCSVEVWCSDSVDNDGDGLVDTLDTEDCPTICTDADEDGCFVGDCPDGTIMDDDDTKTRLHESDEDCDGCIDIDEMMNYVQGWYIDSTDVTMLELLQAINFFKKGTGCE